jgi:hypothetical protein
MKIEKVLKELKGFDMYYEMSDSHQEWLNGTAHERRIQSMLSELTAEEKQEIVEELKPTPERIYGHDVLVRYFDDSFEGFDLMPSDQYKKQFKS